MFALKVNFGSREAILNDFDLIADKFCNDINIKINKKSYRIIDFEFYAYSETFQDPHTHKNKLQLENSKIYLHSWGVDLTFGDGINYGGILIRSIIKLYDGSEKESGFMKEQFDGPQKVATELFSNLNNLDNNELNEISLIDVNERKIKLDFYPANFYIKTKRVGLKSVSDDSDNYHDLPLRYIAILYPLPKFKQNIKGIENLLAAEIKSGKLTPEEASIILGYNKIYL